MLVTPLTGQIYAPGSNVSPARFAATRRADLAEHVQVVTESEQEGGDAGAQLRAQAALHGGAEAAPADGSSAATVHFVYRRVLENGRPAAKRTPQNTDKDWSFVLDRKA